MRKIALALAAIVGVCPLIAQDGMQISWREELSHRLTGDHFIRADNPPMPHVVGVRVSVDETGAVTHAEATDGPEEFRVAAVTLAKTWTYQPFEKDGHAAAVTFASSVSLLPPEKAPCGHAAFPEIHDWKSVTIKLTRTRCFGTCAAYELEIDGNGNVVFEGEYPVSAERRGFVSQAALEGLVDKFRTANYFSLCPSYRLGATDLPAFTTSISIDGKSMSVQDYGGFQVGMPVSVREIEDAIDEAAGTSKWLRR
jgi:hypothetical protein